MNSLTNTFIPIIYLFYTLVIYFCRKCILEIRGDPKSPLLLYQVEEREIKEIVESVLQEDESLFLVEVLVKGNTGNQKVLVFVDGDNGISIDQCSRVSRQVGSIIEERDLMPGKYTLEVSSPGLDFPLMLTRQYRKNVGRTLLVETLNGEKVEGKLVSAGEDLISLEMKKEEKSFPYDEIKQSKVKISFK